MNNTKNKKFSGKKKGGGKKRHPGGNGNGGEGSPDPRDYDKKGGGSDSDAGETGSRENDWRWYAQSPELIRDYASYPFGYPVGALTGMPWTSASIKNYAVPGVMALYFQPTIGYADGENSPINVAMRKFYTEVRKSNSGATNYEAPDMMMYLLAMDSVFMYVSYLKRLYGVIMQATPLNRYYSKALVQAMYVNYEDIVKHLPDLRGFINLLCAKSNALCIPNTLSYMARHSWMCEGIYLDSNTGKAQSYMYVPTDFYTYGAVSTEQPATNLTYKELIPEMILLNTAEGWTGLLGFDDLVQFGWDLLNPLIADQATNVMSGDILKAYGPEGIVRLVGIPDEYLVLPAFRPEVSSQIENATVTGLKLRDTAITQSLGIGTGYIVSQPSVAFRVPGASSSPAYTDGGAATIIGGILGSSRLLNMHHDGVTPEEVMVATRLMNIPNTITANPIFPVARPGSSGYYNGIKTICRSLGSEVVVGAHMFRLQEGTNSGMGNTNSVVFFSSSASYQMAAVASAFDWAPMIYPYNVQVAQGKLTEAYATDLFGDVDNYAILDAANLENMSAVALLSEFWV